MTGFRQVEQDIFIGPQPGAEDLEAARKQGIRTVIDCRLPAETAHSNARLSRDHGLDYASVPVDKAQLSMQQVDRFSQALAGRQGPYLVHCATGARAVLMLVLHHARESGWTAERVFEEARKMGVDLQNSPDFARFVREATGGAA